MVKSDSVKGQVKHHMSQLTFHLTLLRYSDRAVSKYVLLSALFITVVYFVLGGHGNESCILIGC